MPYGRDCNLVTMLERPQLLQALGALERGLWQCRITQQELASVGVHADVAPHLEGTSGVLLLDPFAVEVGTDPEERRRRSAAA